MKEAVTGALAWLKRHGTKATREGMARYGITADKAYGVTMADIKVLAKQLGRDHALALALWDTGWYEARLLAPLIDEPDAVTPAQMDRWCKDFDSWAVCDTACFHLFDRTPHAWKKVTAWAKRREEFQRRAAFALLASLALHRHGGPDEPYLAALPLIEAAADDDRNFIKKALSWALRGIGGRNLVLHGAASALATRLAASPEKAARWLGKDALRGLNSPAVKRRVAARARAS